MFRILCKRDRYRHTVTNRVIPVSGLAFTQVDKFLPLYQRKKVLQQQRPPPAVFEMTPCSGMLSPGERVNVHIKFSPAEGVNSLIDF